MKRVLKRAEEGRYFLSPPVLFCFTLLPFPHKKTGQRRIPEEGYSSCYIQTRPPKTRPPSWLQALALNDDIISALLKQTENSSSERGRDGEEEKEKEGAKRLRRVKA